MKISEFVKIPVESLCFNTMPPFDLYLAVDGHPPVLYREKDLTFDESVQERLKENHVEDLYIDKRSNQIYQQYVEQNLPQILNNPGIAPQEKATILYGSATSLVEDLMQNPRSKMLVARSREMVNSAVEFVFSQAFSVRALLNVTCYDYYTYTHSVNVFLFSVGVARHLDLTKKEALLLGNGALLHDIGKSRLDPSIVNCRGKLNAEQWAEMRQHPLYGYKILVRQGVADELVLDVTRHHHEKMDGSGYPDGIKGEDVSLYARISTICDIFDALTTKRPYKDAMDTFHALQLMKAEMQTHLDQELFRKFILLLQSPGENT